MIGTISNYKGGTGKTITAVNLSAMLALLKKKVLVIDIDPQSDSTRALMQPHVEIDESMFHILHEEAQQEIRIKDIIYPTIHENLHIIPNITETSGLEIPLAKDFPNSNLMLRRFIYEHASENYDYVFIDCPPTLSVFVANALYASDFVLIPMLAGSGNSLEGINGVLKLMEEVKKNGNPDLRFLKILINKVDRRKKAHKVNMLAAEERFGKENIFETAIPTSGMFEILETMPGTSIVSRRNRSEALRGSRAFKAIAREFLDFFEPEGKENVEWV